MYHIAIVEDEVAFAAQLQEYLEKYQLSIVKTKNIPSTRGNIYDTKGELLAYNDLAYTVKIEDVYESSSTKNAQLNNNILTLIKMIEKNGDKVISDFHRPSSSRPLSEAVKPT